PEPHYRQYVEKAEGLADADARHGGMLSCLARTPVEQAAGRLVAVLVGEACLKNTKLALWAAADVLGLSLRARGGDGIEGKSAVALRAPAEADNARLVRCVFGNPFRPAKFDPTWQTTDAIALARGISEECAWERLPILGDALEEAGCDHA